MSDHFDTPTDQSPQLILWSSSWNERWPWLGLEHVMVRARSADAVILGVDDADQPFRIEYRITWDERWRTREATIDARVAGASSSTRLAADGAGSWREVDGRDLPQLSGCFDLDIWPTPFTNTLAIRRLQLEPGQRIEIDVVYVSAIEGRVQRARQAYTRGYRPDRFRFEDLGSDFAAELKVDRFGLVTEYPALFTRVWPPTDHYLDVNE